MVDNRRSPQTPDATVAVPEAPPTMVVQSPVSLEEFVDRYLAAHPRWVWAELHASFLEAVDQGLIHLP